MKRLLLLVGLLAIGPDASAQSRVFTHADTLRGSITPERAWWDVTFYDLHVRLSPADSSISGVNHIRYRVTGPTREMQFDLQAPLVADSIVQDGIALSTRRDGNALFVTLTAPQPLGTEQVVAVHYHGKPIAAKNAPWDGGIVWAHDSLGRPWIASAVQGLGASAWWPTKDIQADEPDSQRIRITVPSSMTDVSNGRLASIAHHGDGSTTYEWIVRNPINNYDVALNAGSYAHFHQVYAGEDGPLDLDFWPLSYHETAAKSQFAQVRPMLACFEHWFGPYPWYADGYKLVETPHLGMEHQSAVAYGNHYHNGYLGRDLSGTGLGLTWDYIIIHESAHEWWGNNITSADIADMWVHESFAMYAEGLYVECMSGKEAGARYIAGVRRGVRNDAPVIGAYGVQNEGSGDMYYKGANMLHTIRQLVNNDDRWRDILRGLNTTFRHRVVSGWQVQDYMSAVSGLHLAPVFQQYLTTTKIPVLEYSVTDSTLRYRWTNVVPGFDMPVRVTLGSSGELLLYPTETWSTEPVHAPSGELKVSPNFYVVGRAVAP